MQRTEIAALKKRRLKSSTARSPTFNRLSKIHSIFPRPSPSFSPFFTTSRSARRFLRQPVRNRIDLGLRRCLLPIFATGGGDSRAQRLKMFQFCARERECSLCKDWSRAEKAARRLEVTCFPAGICLRCDLVFWQALCTVISPEEDAALQETLREERSKDVFRRTSEVLRESRSEAAKH
jgi:hypothetical protein